MTLDYFYTFSQTVLIETPIYFFFLQKVRSWRDLMTGIFAINAFTHPIVFFGLMAVAAAPLAKIAISEAFAPAFEAWALCYFLRVPWWRAVVASVLANLASWQLGPVFTYWIYY